MGCVLILLRRHLPASLLLKARSRRSADPGQRSLFEQPEEVSAQRPLVTARGQQMLFNEPLPNDASVYIAEGVHAGRLGRVIGHRMKEGRPIYRVETVHGTIDENVPHESIVLPDAPVQWSEEYPDPVIEGVHTHPKHAAASLQQIINSQRLSLDEAVRGAHIAHTLHAWYKSHPYPRKALREVGMTGAGYGALLKNAEKTLGIRIAR